MLNKLGSEYFKADIKKSGTLFFTVPLFFNYLP